MSEIDEEIKKVEEEIKNLEDKGVTLESQYGSPEPEKKDSIYKFFREILHLPESWKVGNLKNDEIGRSRLSVRSYLELAEFNYSEGQNKVANYFKKKADIVASTSMGRDGFVVKTIVTSIKKEDKGNNTPMKRTLFGGWKKDESAQPA